MDTTAGFHITELIDSCECSEEPDHEPVSSCTIHQALIEFPTGFEGVKDLDVNTVDRLSACSLQKLLRVISESESVSLCLKGKSTPKISLFR